MEPIQIGDASISLLTQDTQYLGLGAITVNGHIVRTGDVPMLPWFDSYEGGTFNRFELLGVEPDDQGVQVKLKALADMSFPFRERRDSSGDLCFNEYSWTAKPFEALVTLHIQPTQETIDGRSFSGFKYWYTGQSDQRPVHRFIDRQTWELGGNLNDVTVCIRNWISPPHKRLGIDVHYSTVGLENYVGPMPGNLWGRWTQLPGFDMQYGQEGILIGRFDEVANIRTAMESIKGEDFLKVQDFHFFEQTNNFVSLAKTILHCSDTIDKIEALNVWTRCTDRESDMSRAQFGIEDDPMPRLVEAINIWVNYRFETTYEYSVDVSSELGLDHLFIDTV